MFCRSCGKQLPPGATICTCCGVPVGVGRLYCPNCGNSTLPEAVVCVKCGCKLMYTNYYQPPGSQGSVSSKSKIAAGLLGIFLGAFGVHNFYLGYTNKAVVQLVLGILTFFTCGLTGFVSGIWGFVEGIILLASSNATDANGYPLI